MKCTIYPQKISQLNKDQMEELIFNVLQHVNRTFIYNTGPVELTNRLLTELVENDLVDLDTGGCGSCNSCTPPQGPKKEGKVIEFPKNKS